MKQPDSTRARQPKGKATSGKVGMTRSGVSRVRQPDSTKTPRAFLGKRLTGRGGDLTRKGKKFV